MIPVEMTPVHTPGPVYTPGPWEVWEGHTSVFAGPARENDRGAIIGTRRQICELSDHWDRDEEEDAEEMAANACLIAAAPELLKATEALQHLARCMATGPGWTPELFEDILGYAASAVAKAKGESREP